jgi:hypothetical protein
MAWQGPRSSPATPTPAAHASQSAHLVSNMTSAILVTASIFHCAASLPWPSCSPKLAAQRATCAPHRPQLLRQPRTAAPPARHRRHRPIHPHQAQAPGPAVQHGSSSAPSGCCLASHAAAGSGKPGAEPRLQLLPGGQRLVHAAQVGLLRRAQRHALPKVQQRDAAVFVTQEEVPGMRVGVEQPVVQRHVPEHLQQREHCGARALQQRSVARRAASQHLRRYARQLESALGQWGDHKARARPAEALPHALPRAPRPNITLAGAEPAAHSAWGCSVYLHVPASPPHLREGRAADALLHDQALQGRELSDVWGEGGYRPLAGLRSTCRTCVHGQALRSRPSELRNPHGRQAG